MTFAPNSLRNNMSEQRILSLLKNKCPKCESGDVFKEKGSLLRFKMPVMNENCPACGHRFEREPGYFFGAMYVSYAITVIESVIVFLLWEMFNPGNYDFRMIGLIALVQVILLFVNFRLSRMVWMYLFTEKEQR